VRDGISSTEGWSAGACGAEDFALDVAEDEDTEGGVDVDEDSGLEVGGPGFASGGFVFSVSTSYSVSWADCSVWLVEILPEATARSDPFRDETELELALGDTLFNTFFSTESPFPVVPPG